MRDRREIEKELFAARCDLEGRLAELRQAVRAKTHVRARVRLMATKRPRVYAAIVGVIVGAITTLVLARRWSKQ
jgi:hypothetical protein